MQCKMWKNKLLLLIAMTELFLVATISGQYPTCINVVTSSQGLIFHPQQKSSPVPVYSTWFQDLPWPFVCVWGFELEPGETLELSIEELDVYNYLVIEQKYAFGFPPLYTYWVRTHLLPSLSSPRQLTFNHIPVRLHTSKYAGNFVITYKVSYCQSPIYSDEVRLVSCTNGNKWNSICSYKCSNEYTFAKSSSPLPLKTICRSDKQWSHLPKSQCVLKSKVLESCMGDFISEITSDEECNYTNKDLTDMFHREEDENVEFIRNGDFNIDGTLKQNVGPIRMLLAEGSKEDLKSKCSLYCFRSYFTQKYGISCNIYDDPKLCLYCRYGKKVCPFFLNAKEKD